jgi:hypothetical protein
MLRSQIAKNAWPRHAPHHFVRAATVSLPEGKGRQPSEPAKDKAGPRGLAPWVGRMFTPRAAPRKPSIPPKSERPENELRPCARKSLGKGERCNDYTLKTFRWNPAGRESRPVELGQQPEASVACGAGDPQHEAYTASSKAVRLSLERRISREPSSWTLRGPRRRAAWAWRCRSCRGRRTRRRNNRVLQEPGRSWSSPCVLFRLGGTG